MKRKTVYAVKAQMPTDGRWDWLVDTCAGGTWSRWASDAVTWDTVAECLAALVAAEIEDDDLEVVMLVQRARD